MLLKILILIYGGEPLSRNLRILNQGGIGAKPQSRDLKFFEINTTSAI